MDFSYFGPPVQMKGGIVRTSPYWPRTAGWSFSELKAQLPTLLSDLSTIVPSSPNRAVPEKLDCICHGPNCLLPIFNAVCFSRKIPRFSSVSVVSKIDETKAHWIALVHRIKKTPNWLSLVELIGSARASQYVSWYTSLDENRKREIDSAVRSAWKVVDLDMLAFAVSIRGSEMMGRLVERCV